MKAKELRDRSESDLVDLSRQLERELFGHRMKNQTGQLDDTSLLQKTRRDLARIALVRSERKAKAAVSESGSKS
ncbi:MAG TPA: 50S ribosomal protein L29 [Polyangiaceae bacterium]|nr:50S ribosomal protein L29 [Polyangiaceae bacterium]